MINSLLPLCLSTTTLLGATFFSAVQLNNASESYVTRGKLEYLARWCDARMDHACKALAKETNGQCASPGREGGCRYDSNVIIPAAKY